MIRVFSRWDAIKMGVSLIWFASGTSKVGMRVVEDGVVLMGKDVLEELGNA